VCGSYVTVDETAAGTTVTCPCGRDVVVPSWRELNASSSLVEHELSPELVIETLFAVGRMPFESICVKCGAPTSKRIQVITECERAYRKGGFSWATFILSALFLPVKIFYWKEQVEYGRDKVYWLPLPVCQGCREDFQDTAVLRRGLRRVEVYARLLEKFPDAKVRLAGP
jgi:hypothetical protein